MSGWKQSDIESLKKRDFKKISLPATSTNELTKQALKVLTLKNWHVWRQNNGGVYDPVKKVFRANSSQPGISDIIGFHKKTGQFIACEIKAGKDKLSPYQVQFLKDVEEAGCKALVIRSTEDLMKL